MNKIAISLLSGLAGMAIGAVGGYFFCKKRIQDSCYEELRRAIDDECEHLRKSWGTWNRKRTESRIEPSQNENSPTESTDPKPEVNEDFNPYITAIKRCRESVVLGVPSENGPYDKNDIVPTFPYGADLPPLLITFQEFNDLDPMFHYIEWTYYIDPIGGNTILDENDQLVDIEDAQVYLGAALDDILSTAQDGDEAFVVVCHHGVALRIDMRVGPMPIDPYEE